MRKMSENKQKPQKPLNAKQEAFVQAYCTPNSKTYNNATQSAIAAGYKPKYISKNIGQITGNKGVQLRIDQIRADSAAETKTTRELQEKRLNYLYEMAVRQENVTAAKGVINELSQMLGYHQELAPNAEKEAAKRARMSKAEEELAAELASRINRKKAEEGDPGRASIVKPDFGQKRA